MLVRTDALTKRYGSFAALHRCTIEVAAGEVFGLLGPNGAGKTTLIRLLLGFLRPSAGWATIDSLDCFQRSVDVHRRVAYLPGEPRLWGRMRGGEVLRFFARVRRRGPLARSLQLAERFDLDLRQRVAFMSTGTRQKLALVATLAADVPLYVLDEPTSSLDPNVRREVVRLIQQARSEGRTVLFSSHVLPEIEDVCDRCAILRYGEVVHTQDMPSLGRRHRITARLTAQLPAVPDVLQPHVQLRQDGNQLILETELELTRLFGWLATAPLDQVRIEPVGLRVIYEQYHGDPDDHP